MKKRLKKKRDNQLKIAIRELNNDVAMDLGAPPITYEEVAKVLERIRINPDSINQTFTHYKKYIQNK